MEILFVSSLLISSILNRLRGTGLIKHFGTLNVGSYKVEVKLVWNHVYGLYLALIVGLLSMNIYAGLLTLVAYLVGESKGWGEWVGSLSRCEPWTEKLLEDDYSDTEGKTFPFIHQIANSICKEQIDGTFEQKCKQYRKYATLALALRGAYWWLPVYLVIAYFGVISYAEAIMIGVLLGLSFPIACKLGKLWNFNKKIGIISFSRGWENQELAYGFMQGIALWYVIISNTI